MNNPSRPSSGQSSEGQSSEPPYKQGYEAYLLGEDSNPPEDCEDKLDWILGFTDAMLEGM